MKNLNLYYAVAIVALMTSCGGGQTSTANGNSMDNGSNSDMPSTSANTNSNVKTSNRTTVNGTTSPRTTTNSMGSTNTNGREITNDNTAINDSNRQNEIERQRMLSMYKSLGMDSDQISRYENDTKAYMDTWSTSNPDKPMTGVERQQYRDKTIKPIISETQYGQYQQWMKDNTPKN